MPDTQKKPNYVYLDGEILEYDDPRAKLGLKIHPLHYSGSVFEGEVLEGGFIFRSWDHSVRLIQSADMVRLQHGLTPADVEKAKERVIAANEYDHAYVRAFIFRGEQLGVNPRNLKVRFGVVADPSKRQYWPPHVYEQGLKIFTASNPRVPKESVPQIAKAGGNYQAGMLAQMEANENGYDEAVMTGYPVGGKFGNFLGGVGFRRFGTHVLEGSVFNFSCFKKDVLWTPLADKRFLAGITRDTEIQLARDLGFKVKECLMNRRDFYEADEAVGAGSATRLTPILRYDDKQYKLEPVPEEDLSSVWFNVSGPRTLMLMKAYAEALKKPWDGALMPFNNLPAPAP